MFCCHSCVYKSKKKFNLQKHVKNVHKRDCNDDELLRTEMLTINTHVLTEDTQILTENTQKITKNTQMLTENTQKLTQNMQEKITLEKNLFCTKCLKTFSTSHGLKKHHGICKGVSNILECHYCHRIYSSKEAKSRHLKTCKVKEVQLVVQDYNQTNNITNNTQNNNQQIQYIIQYFGTARRQNRHNRTNYDDEYNSDDDYDIEKINDFGKEDISYIDEETMKKIASNNDIKTFIMLKHFNPEHPENHNIRLNCKKSFKILKNKIWTSELKQIVASSMFNQAYATTHNFLICHNLSEQQNQTKKEDYDIPWQLCSKRIHKTQQTDFIEMKLADLVKMRFRNKKMIENDV